MYMIPLNGSDQVAFVDDEDSERVLQYTWRLAKHGSSIVPITRINGKYVRLNRFILGRTPGDGTAVFPANDNALDCQKSNLIVGESGPDPTKSWDRRKKRSELAVTIPKPTPTVQCKHDVLVAEPHGYLYRCFRCDTHIEIGRIVPI